MTRQESGDLAHGLPCSLSAYQMGTKYPDYLVLGTTKTPALAVHDGYLTQPLKSFLMFSLNQVSGQIP